MSNTPEDRYAARKAIADKINERIAEARAVLGDADAYGQHVIRDKTGAEPEQRFYCCRRNGSDWRPSLEEVFPRLGERLSDKYFDNPKTGERYYYFRWEVGLAPLVPYQPQTPDQMRKAEATRERKRLEREQQRYALFQAEVVAEQSKEIDDSLSVKSA